MKSDPQKQLRQRFREVWMADFEFSPLLGESPKVVCLVAREFFSGRTLRFKRDELYAMRQPPFSIADDALFVAYNAVAEISCFLVLGWPSPAHVLDLFVEFRCLTNGIISPKETGLLYALRYHDIPGIDAREKETMQQLACRGGVYTDEEWQALLEYCETDVVALDKLLPRMLPKIDMPRALLRGRYMGAVARIEHNGTSIDGPLLGALKAHWQAMQADLISKVDADYHVYEAQAFKIDKFALYLEKKGIAWPVLESGRLDLQEGTFKDMAKIHPELLPLKELRATISGMRLSGLTVGSDGRNRCPLFTFGSTTGRNQPSNTKYIFGPAVWMRGLIKPGEDSGIAYIDWSQQEFGIAAALSDDPLMMDAYASGDPYLEFAKQAGAVPNDATKQSHKLERELFKACVLAVQYGMGAKSLAYRIGKPEIEAERLLELHRQTYRRFWEWSDAAVSYAMLNNRINTVFGWQLHVGHDPNPRSLRNFPMQANGAEMLRLACIYGIDAGIKICAPVHDALLIEAPLGVLDEQIAIMQSCMERASIKVLGDFALRSGVEKFAYPDRYMDERGVSMWRKVMSSLETITGVTPTPVPGPC